MIFQAKIIKIRKAFGTAMDKPRKKCYSIIHKHRKEGLSMYRNTDDVITLFRTLHQIPEYGDRLPNTKKLVCAVLDEIGVSYTCFEGHDSIVAEIAGAHPGKTVAYRADMDALRIQEETGLPYASRVDGFMHACGHDAHTAIALCAARALYERRAELHGTIRFLFEAGEETSNGALHLLEENLMDGVDAVFSLHIGTLAGREIPNGKFVILPGAVTAGKDAFSIEIEGVGGHGAYPHEAIDPVRIAAGVITAMQSVVSMEVPSGNGAVITFGSIHGGTDNNSIPKSVTLNGTVRTQSEEVRQYISRRIREIVEQIPPAFGGKGSCTIRRGSNCAINHPTLATLAADAIAAKLGEDAVIRSMPKALMGSDDFARLSEIAPGVYFFLSTANPDKHTDYPHHNAKFAVDEDMLGRGVEGVVAILTHSAANF